MMKVTKHIFVFIFGIVALIGCDIVDDPFLTPPEPYGDRVIVVEDYTGHRCKNCPKAAKQLKEIEAAYGDRVIGIGVHAGPGIFTAPSPPDYPTDFRTQDGNAMANFFNIAFLPVGMVSRIGWTSSGSEHLQAYTQWPTTVNDNIAKFAEVVIESSVSYNSGDSTATVNVEVTTVEDLDYALKYVVLILEDNIVSPQLMPDDSRDTAYVHHHVLRDAFTQALGDDLTTSSTKAGTNIMKQISGTVRKSAWNEDECEIVVYVSNAETYEILQATKFSLK